MTTVEAELKCSSAYAEADAWDEDLPKAAAPGKHNELRLTSFWCSSTMSILRFMYPKSSQTNWSPSPPVIVKFLETLNGRAGSMASHVAGSKVMFACSK